MATNYPNGIDTFPTHTDNIQEKIMASHLNNVQDSIVAMQTNLGKRYKQPIAPTIGVDNAVAGDEWYDTTENRLKYCNGTSWIDPLKYV